MEKQYKKLPDSELEVMLAVWGAGEAVHTGEILQRLDPDRKRRLQTVQILLGRLVEKGFLRCEKVGRLNYYTPLVPQEEYRTQETASFIEKMYGSSPARLVAALVQEHSLSAEDFEEIRRILEKGGEG